MPLDSDDYKVRMEMVVHQIKVLNDRVDKFDAQSIENERFFTLLEVQMEATKEMQSTMKELTSTLNNINMSQNIMGENLNNVNKTISRINEKVERLEIQRQEELINKSKEKKKDNNKDGKGEATNLIQDNQGKIIVLLIVIIAGLLGINLPL